MASLTSEGWKDTLWEHKELASSVFSRMTHLKADDDKARAKAGRNEAQGGLIEKAYILKCGKAWFMLVKKCLSRIGL